VTLDRLRDDLAGARAALLEAMAGLTERDFAQEIDGATITQWLAAIAPAERDAVRRARRALGLDERRLPAGREGGRVLPPQVVHDLAGARYETTLLLEAATSLEASDIEDATDAGESVAELLAAVAERDAEVARRIEARPPRASGGT
jgi:hypothetical protein